MAYKKMNPEYKTAWVDILRHSGYAQGQDSLVSTMTITRDGFKAGTHKFCCLGVATNEFGDEEWDATIDEVCIVQKTDGGKRFGSNAKTLNSDAGYPSRKLVTEMGLSATAIDKLASLNDGGSTFSEIADWIEDNM